MYNLKITKNPFDGTFSIKRRYKLITDADGKVLGGVTKKHILDLNGEKVGFLKEAFKTVINGEEAQKVFVFDSEYGELKITGDLLYLNDRLIGTVDQRVRNASSIIMLAIATMFLVATLVLIALIDLPFADVPAFDVVDTGGEWNAQGEICVLDNTIHPGTSGSYDFIINNPYNVTLGYHLVITEQYNNQPVEDFPLEFRLKMNNALINTEEWLSAEELEYNDMMFMPFSSQRFTLEWRWLFESGDDEGDTLLGIENGTYRLVFNMTAEVEEVE